MTCKMDFLIQNEIFYCQSVFKHTNHQIRRNIIPLYEFLPFQVLTYTEKNNNIYFLEKNGIKSILYNL